MSVSTPAPIIRTRGLSKSFEVAEKQPGLMGTVRHFLARKTRTIEAVKAADLEVQAGEIVGFLGPNGAGKTTTLKMLTGLIHPTAGEVEVCDHVPSGRQADFLRRITLVMGNKQQLIWDLPALDSLRINAAVYEVAPEEAERRTSELAAMLEIEEQLKQPVRKLSLGQRMKVELLAALLHRPEVLFLDEPTLGLDVNAQATIRSFLRAYNQKHGATLLLTSHYMADITALCRRVVLIDKGELIYDGDLEALLEKHTPHREVTVETADALSSDALPAVGHVVEVDGRRARIQVERDALPAALAALLEKLEVVDLSVKDPPVEEIIGAVFRGAGREELARDDEEAP